MSGEESKVEGIGTVELPTQRKHKGSGAELHSTMKLVEVFHVPSSVCNIIGQPRHNEYDVVDFRRGYMFGVDGKRIAFFDPCRPLCQVKLSGPPVGPEVGSSALQHGKNYFIGVYWSSLEQQRWEAYQANMVPSKAAHTVEEKAWLKKHYRGEFRFLSSYGLKIHDEEDIEEGRSILRALMHEDD